jgi:MoaA/NifB/PqqE/SkfB family radical SAM enzyme
MKYLRLLRPLQKKGALHFAADYFYRRIRRHHLSNPLYITFQVTDNCNLKCRFCNYYNTTSDRVKLSKYGNMDLKLFKKCIDEIEGKPLIAITGGEPTIHPDIYEMISIIKKKGLLCSMVTNGTLLKSSCDRLVNSGVDFLAISIDGVGGTHDKVRGVKGTFSLAIEGIKKVLAYPDRPIVVINSVLAPDTYHELPRLVEYLEKNIPGIDMMNIQQVWYRTPAQVNKHNNLPLFKIGNVTNFELTKDIDRLWSTMQAIKKIKTSFMKNIYPDLSREELQMYYANDRAIKNFRPRCLWESLPIKNDGSICVCEWIKVGDAQTQNLMDVWRGEEYSRLRKWCKEKGMFPICTRCCELFH